MPIKEKYDPQKFQEEIKKPVDLGGKSSLLSGGSLNLSQGKSPFSFGIQRETSHTTSPDFSLSSAGGDISLSPEEGKGTEEAMEYVNKGEKAEKEYYPQIREAIKRSTNPLREANLKATLAKKLEQKEFKKKKKYGFDIEVPEKDGIYHVEGKKEEKSIKKEMKHRQRLENIARRKGVKIGDTPISESKEIKDMPIQDIEEGKAEGSSLDTSGMSQSAQESAAKIGAAKKKIEGYEFGKQPKTLSGISEGISLTQPISEAVQEDKMSSIAQDLTLDKDSFKPINTPLKKEKETDFPEMEQRKVDAKDIQTDPIVGFGGEMEKEQEQELVIEPPPPITKEKAEDIVAEKLGLGPKKITPKQEVVKKKTTPPISSDTTTGKLDIDPTILKEHKQTSESKVYPTRTRTGAEAKIQAKEQGLKGKSKREYVKTAVEKWKTKDDKPTPPVTRESFAAASSISKKLKGWNP